MTTLAISGIAWPPEEETEVASALAMLGIRAVEIAPTKVFADPPTAERSEVADYVAWWRDLGIEVVAFQSMLFGREDLVLFGADDVRRATLGRLRGFIELAGRMGAGVLVFGSPRNRRVPDDMPAATAWGIAVPFFRELGRIADGNGVRFCIEPNPPRYACNFVTTSGEGVALVDEVAHPGFGLHLDVAGMTLAGENVGEAILAAGTRIRHFHVSAPDLGEISGEGIDHASAASALAAIGYESVISIEMRPGAPGEGVTRASRAIEFARSAYRSILG